MRLSKRRYLLTITFCPELRERPEKTSAQGTRSSRIHELPARLDQGLMINVDADHSVKFDAKLVRDRLVSSNFCLYRLESRASRRDFFH